MSKQTPSQKKKISPATVAGMVIGVLIGGCAGFFGAGAIDSLTDGNDALFSLYLGLALAGMMLAFFTQIIIHEGGHLLFGRMSGYRFVSFNVLGFIWKRDEQGRLRVGRMQIAGAGGQCLMAPPDYDGGRFPFTLYNLGGVLMNLISALICAVLMAWIPAAWVRILLAMQAIVAVFFALLNGLPIPVAAIQNDGKNLLCIRRDETARRAFWLQMAMAAETARGVRLRDMPEDWFAPLPEEKMDNPIVSTIGVFRASRRMDALDFAAAEAEIRALLARKKGVLDLYRMTLSCDGAVCELLRGAPGPLCEAVETPANQQLMNAMKTNPSLLRTKYALALLRDRDVTRAEKCLADFESAAKTHPYPQEIAGEREILLAIQAAA